MDERPHHERIDDPVFRRAVALIDSGDVEALRGQLAQRAEYAGRADVVEFLRGAGPHTGGR